MSNAAVVPIDQRQRRDVSPLPQDLDAEAAVLSAIMLEAETLELVIGELRPEHFYSEANRRIYEAARDLAADGKPIDVVTIAGLLRDRERLEQVGGSKYIADLCDKVPAVARIETYARRIVEKWQLRTAREKATAIAASVATYAGDVRAFLQAAEGAFHELAGTGAVDTIAISGEAYRRKRAAIDDVRRGITPSGGLATGFADVDRFTGGLTRGTLNVIAARPGIGKSALALQIATHVASSWVGAVPFFTKEMLIDEMLDRQLSQATRIDHDRIRRPDLWTAEQEATIDQAWRELSGLPIWWDEGSGLSVLEIKARTKRIAREAGKRWKMPDDSPFPLALIVVDHLGKIGEPEHLQHRDRHDAVAYNCEELKALAKTTGVPVLLLAQLNREGEKQGRKPRLSDLAESGKIEREADRIWFLHRAKRHEEMGTAELIVAKARGGREGTIELHWNGPNVRFDNAQQPRML